MTCVDHFVQINLAYFNSYNVVTHKNIFTYANFIKALTCSDIGNTHGKCKIVSTSHKFINWPIVSTNPLLSAILYMNTNCVSVRPSDDVLATFSVAEPATENYLSYFVLSRAGRPGQPLGGGLAGGGVARAGHLLFSTVTFLPYTFQ